MAHGSIIRTFLSAVAMLMTCAASAGTLKPFTGLYTLSAGSMTVGEVELSLSLPSDGDYHYVSRSRPTGLLGTLVGGHIEEQSRGEMGTGVFRPLHYRYQRKGRKSRVVALDFDWRRQRVTNTVNNDPWTMAIEPATVDKLSVQLALMRDLKAGKERMTYHVADGGTLKVYRYQRSGEEVVETPLGTMNSVRVRQNRGRDNRYTELWCAPSLGYLPVRVIQYRDGEEHARMDLQQLNPAPR